MEIYNKSLNYYYQVPRIVTIKRDSDQREMIPVELAGWLLGEYMSRRKVYGNDGRDGWMDGNIKK